LEGLTLTVGHNLRGESLELDLGSDEPGGQLFDINVKRPLAVDNSLKKAMGQTTFYILL